MNSSHILDTAVMAQRDVVFFFLQDITTNASANGYASGAKDATVFACHGAQDASSGEGSGGHGMHSQPTFYSWIFMVGVNKMFSICRIFITNMIRHGIANKLKKPWAY